MQAKEETANALKILSLPDVSFCLKYKVVDIITQIAPIIQAQ